MSSRLIVTLLLLLQGTAALAEDTPAPPSRAQRDADNPLRMIIEAGKIKPRARAAESDKAARVPERVQVRARSAADAAQPPGVASQRTQDALAPVAAPAAAPVAAAAAPAPAPAAPEPLAAAPAAPMAPNLAAESVTRVPESKVGEVIVVAPAAPAPAPAPVAVAAPPEPLKVLTMVEPTLPRRLLGRVQGDIEVIVTFMVGTDGSVSQAAVQASNQPLANPTVLEAVTQWRYAPIAAARSHAVQLVMRAGD